MIRIAFGILLATGSLAAAEPAGAKLRGALDATGDIVLEEKSLVDLAAYFQSKLKCEVRFDRTAVLATGLDPEAPAFTVRQRGGKVRDGLQAVLANVNLAAANVGGTLYIGTEADVVARQLRQRVSVDGEATTLAAVLKSLSDTSGANVVLDPRVAAKAGTAPVKLKLDDVPLETAVRLTAEVADFAVVRLNNVLFVTSEDRAARLAAVADPPAQPAAPTAPWPGFGFGPPPKPSDNR